MITAKFKKPVVHDSRASFCPSYLDEDPDIDLIQPDPEDPAEQTPDEQPEPPVKSPFRVRPHRF